MGTLSAVGALEAAGCPVAVVRVNLVAVVRVNLVVVRVNLVAVVRVNLVAVVSVRCRSSPRTARPGSRTAR